MSTFLTFIGKSINKFMQVIKKSMNINNKLDIL